MSKSTRRKFLADATAGVMASALFSTVKSSAAGANERVRVGLIGLGLQGKRLQAVLPTLPDLKIAYVCDIDKKRLAEGVARTGAKGVTDFRRILDDPTIDGVTVATPDHWHVPAALLALDAGKHVYVEKPCSYNFQEGQLLVEAVKQRQLVFQHGTQARSSAGIRQAIGMLHEGLIGDVLIARCWNWQRRNNIGHLQPSEPPSGVDYDTWVGPAPWMPFQANRFHYDWHWWYNFGSGGMGNDGVHDVDYAMWGLGVDRVAGHHDGVDVPPDMYQNMREPGAVVTKDGVVVVCQAGNKNGWPERSGQDLIVRISSDNARTWSVPHLVAQSGPYSINPHAMVYDSQADRIVMLYNAIRWDFTKVISTSGRGFAREWRAARDEVLSRGEHLRLQYRVSSDDHGRTWSDPIDISDQMPIYGERYSFGSGDGIELTVGPHKGRLIIAGGGIRHDPEHPDATIRQPFVFYSDDHGLTWRYSEPALVPNGFASNTESRVAQRKDGTVVLSCRAGRGDEMGQRTRTLSFSQDGGVTWSRLAEAAGMTYRNCNGDILVVRDKQGLTDTLLSVLPAGPDYRQNGTIWVSFDGGKTWPHKKLIVPGPSWFGYSSIVQLPDGTFAVFYETGGNRQIRYVTFDLQWLLAGVAAEEASSVANP